MEPIGAYEIIGMTIRAVLWSSGPILIAALLIGVGIAFFQALTQIQEMTLTFVPKIIAIFVALIFTTPFMFATLTRLSDRIFDLIVSGGV